MVDPGDPRLRGYAGLTDAGLRRGLEESGGMFVVEGAVALRQLVCSGWRILSALLLDRRADALAEVVGAAEASGAPVYVGGREVLDAVAGFRVHRGVLALGQRRPDPPLGALLQGRLPVVIVEGVNDHENMGAIFRNAAALGAGAVLLDPTCCDPLYRRAVRVSAGQVLRVPFATAEPWPEVLGELAARGFTLVALSPAGAETIDRVAETTEGPVGVVVGSEGRGLSAGALAAAAHVARIPMATGVDSINVAAASAIALHLLASRDRSPW